MATHWYCKILGSERGPVTVAELRSLVTSGGLDVCDLVRSEDADTWQRVDCVDELFGTLDALPPSGDSDLSCDRATSDLPSTDSSWCSLELQSTDTKASIKWTVGSTPTVVNKPESARRASIVKVPRRSLKVSHGATKNGRAEKLARQTTIAAQFNAEADTVVSPEVIDSGPEPTPDHVE